MGFNFVQWLDFLDERVGISHNINKLIDVVVAVLLSKNSLYTVEPDYQKCLIG
jgi:hypothetical protein